MLFWRENATLLIEVQILVLVHRIMRTVKSVIYYLSYILPELYITWVIYYLSYNSYFIIKSLVINWWDFKLFGYFKLFADFKYQYAVRIIGWWEHRFAPESRVSSIPNIKLRASSIQISESARGQLLKFCVLTVQKISNKSEQFSMLLAEQFSCII